MLPNIQERPRQAAPELKLKWKEKLLRSSWIDFDEFRIIFPTIDTAIPKAPSDGEKGLIRKTLN
jgi:hypothetical protein